MSPLAPTTGEPETLSTQQSTAHAQRTSQITAPTAKYTSPQLLLKLIPTRDQVDEAFPFSR
jgi:hypothetical protein